MFVCLFVGRCLYGWWVGAGEEMGTCVVSECT